MTFTARIKEFNGQFPKAGPILWIMSAQYFFVQLVVGLSYRNHYSVWHNTISDLGNTMCGPYGDRLVCSPQHGLFNSSIIILGITMIFGTVLLSCQFQHNKTTKLGFVGIALAGFGSILVGLSPENGSRWGHIVGAALPFVAGNVGLILLGAGLQIPRRLRTAAVMFGLTSLVALVLLVTRHYTPLGIGGIERIVAYPQTIWLIWFGWYALKLKPSNPGNILTDA